MGIAYSVLVLLPGFLLLLVRQSTGEYERLSSFEATVVSVGYSVVVFFLFLSLSALLEWMSAERYGAFAIVKDILSLKKVPPLKARFFLSSLLIYLDGFVISALWIYNSHWIGFWKKIRIKLGLHRFTEHLTPWEDFLTLNKFNWLAVELKDGRTLVGKVGAFSHLPFQRQLLLKSVEDKNVNSPIIIYDKDRKKVNFGPPVYQSYIPIEEIGTIHSIRDSKIKTVLPKYTSSFLSLLCSSVYLIALVILIVINLMGYCVHPALLDLSALLLAIASITLNLSFLARFS